MPRNHNDGNVWIDAHHMLKHLYTILVGHFDITEHQIPIPFSKGLDGYFTVFRFMNGVAGILLEKDFL